MQTAQLFRDICLRVQFGRRYCVLKKDPFRIECCFPSVANRSYNVHRQDRNCPRVTGSTTWGFWLSVWPPCKRRACMLVRYVSLVECTRLGGGSVRQRLMAQSKVQGLFPRAWPRPSKVLARIAEIWAPKPGTFVFSGLVEQVAHTARRWRRDRLCRLGGV